MKWGASQNQDIAKLQEKVDALKQSLKTAQSDFNKKKKELTSLELQMSTAEGRRKNANDQIAKVQKIETAFQAADAERRKADAVQMSTNGIEINYDQWQKEWNDMTKDALEKIKIAEGNLLSIKERQPGWEANRDKLTADQKAEIKAAHESSQTSVQTATEAIDTAKKQLEQRMKEQSEELERAIQEISKK